MRDNYKTNLCLNVIRDGSCPYSNRCRYAHTHDEQRMFPIRRRIIDILDREESLKNLQPDMIDELKIFTRVCEKCDAKTCIGGINCRNGCYPRKYLICREDLYWGICNDSVCSAIHTTERGLSPIGNCKIEEKSIELSLQTESTYNIDENDDDIDIEEYSNIDNIEVEDIDFDQSIFSI